MLNIALKARQASCSYTAVTANNTFYFVYLAFHRVTVSLVPADLGCPGKEAVKQVFVFLEVMQAGPSVQKKAFYRLHTHSVASQQ